VANGGDPRGLLPGRRVPDGRRLRPHRVLPLGPAQRAGLRGPAGLQITRARGPQGRLRGAGERGLRGRGEGLRGPGGDLDQRRDRGRLHAAAPGRQGPQRRGLRQGRRARRRALRRRSGRGLHGRVDVQPRERRLEGMPRPFSWAPARARVRVARLPDPERPPRPHGGQGDTRPRVRPPPPPRPAPRSELRV
ncbi:MAG: Leucyl/phenylalanyl-tRNA--protein transferase, partial [uncultured Rubrobacteraceae bacterium]